MKKNQNPPSNSSTSESSSSTANKPSPDVHSNIVTVTELEKAQRESRSVGEKVSDGIAAFCGSMVFVYVHIIWFGGWIIVNSLIPGLKFDPFPYTFLTLVVSLEAIFLSTFILISQNHETQLTERRNHLDLQINMLAEQESTKTLELLRAIAEKVGVDVDDTEIEDLLEPIDPAKLVEQIVAASDDDAGKASGTEK